MRDLKKNLIYWGSAYEKLTLGIMAGVLLYSFMTVFINGSEHLETELLGYLWIVTFVVIFVLGYTAVSTYFPLAISMGSSRRASFIAMQIMQHLCAIQYLMFGALAYYFLDRDMFAALGKFLFAILGVILLLLALTNLTCIISYKLGKIAGIIAYVCSLVLIIVILILILVFSNLEDGRHLLVVKEFIQKSQLFWIGLIADIISVVCYYPAMKKADLQF